MYLLGMRQLATKRERRRKSWVILQISLEFPDDQYLIMPRDPDQHLIIQRVDLRKSNHHENLIIRRDFQSYKRPSVLHRDVMLTTTLLASVLAKRKRGWC
jgi:hypothetical protein